MDGSELARMALSRLPRPFTDEVVLHVFCEIERTPHLLKAYEGLLNYSGRYKDRRALNIDISSRVKYALKAKKVGSIEARGCEIVGSVARLDGIDPGWEWD